MNTQKRNLPLVAEIVEATGLHLTHPYDDIVLVEENPLLVRFNDEDPQQIFIHFNVDCISKDKISLTQVLQEKARTLGIQAIVMPSYEMQQREGVDEIDIVFQS